MRYGVIAIIVGLIIAVITAVKFNEIAEMKGHHGYFWWCLLLGFVGWLMVIALPNRKNGPKNTETYDTKSYIEELPDL